MFDYKSIFGRSIRKTYGLEFNARLVLAVDSRSGRTFNTIADVYTDEAQ
jgi:hypothetical protein